MITAANDEIEVGEWNALQNEILDACELELDDSKWLYRFEYRHKSQLINDGVGITDVFYVTADSDAIALKASREWAELRLDEGNYCYLVAMQKFDDDLVCV